MSTLFVVGTPIGNLEDTSARAVRVLGEVGAIAAEDNGTVWVIYSAHREGKHRLYVRPISKDGKAGTEEMLPASARTRTVETDGSLQQGEPRCVVG